MKKQYYLSALIILLSILSLNAQTFDELSENFKSNLNDQKQNHVLNLLKVSLKERRAAECLAAIKPWMQNNGVTDPNLVFELAKAYREAGQWYEAVRYYQRYLSSDKQQSQMTTISVDSTYELLIKFLGDGQKAYSFMLNIGAKYRNFGTAKKYDHWFLRTAAAKKDMLGMSEYLLVVYKDKQTNHKEYETYLKSLVYMLEQEKFDKDVYTTVERLSSLPTVKNWKTKLLWPAKAMLYNFELDEAIASRKQKNFDIEKTKAVLKVAQQHIDANAKDGIFTVAKFLKSYYDGNHTNRLTIHIDLKQKIIFDNLAKANKEETVSHFLRSAYMRGRHTAMTGATFLSAPYGRKLVLKYPKLFNKRGAPPINLLDRSLTQKEAVALAPLLRANRSIDAGPVRSLAEATTFPKAVDVLVKAEMWRYGRLHEPMRRLWDAGPKRDGDYGKIYNKYKRETEAKHNPQVKALMAKAGKSASFADRKATFEKCWKDIYSPTPTIQSADSVLRTVVANSNNNEKDELISILINNDGVGVDILKTIVDRTRITGSNNKPFNLPSTYWESHGSHRAAYSSYIPKVKAKIEQAMQAMANKPNYRIPMPYVGIWFNTRSDFKNKKNIELAKKIAANPAFLSYGQLAGFFAGRNTFGDKIKVAVTQKKKPVVHAELLKLQKNALPEQVFTAFNTVVDRMLKNGRGELISNFEPLGKFPKIDDKTLKNIKHVFSTLVPERGYSTHDHWNVRMAYFNIANYLVKDMQKKQQWNQVIDYTPGLWKYYADCIKQSASIAPLADSLAAFAEAAIEAEKISIAASIAQQGLSMKIQGKQRSMLQSILSKCSAKMGVAEIEVDKNDPTFNIYKAQAEYIQGNETAAWELFNENPSQVGTIVRKLNPDFSFWLIRRCLDKDNVDIAKKIGQELYIWAIREKGSLDMTQEGKLKIAMGDIAFKDGNFVRAKSQYNKIVMSREYRGTDEEFFAYLGIVNVDMTTKDYNAALETLERLILDPSKERRLKAYHMRAKVFFEQENFSEARNDIKKILESDAQFELSAESLILAGKLDNKQRNFEGGEELEFGNRDSKKTVIPGEPITIKLIDQTLSLSDESSTIEVEVWSKSGDSVRVLLRGEGDDKTVFKAKIPSELGRPNKSDKILQILGNDEVTYGYSKRYRQKMKDLPEDNDVVMDIKSNASIAMSAGDFPPKKGERQLDLSQLNVDSSQKALGARRVRPGNPLYIRVIDSDQSTTPGIDTIKVNIETTSGDKINNVVLKETKPYSGEFEGTINTASAITTASASDSEKGFNANDAISPKKEKPWKGDEFYKAKAGPRFYSIDFNDKVALSTLYMECGSEGALNKFLVQTSVDGNRWVNRGSYPKSAVDWDGNPEMLLVAGHPKLKGNPNLGIPESWSKAVTTDTFSSSYKKKAVNNLVAWSDGPAAHPGYTHLVRFRALFFQKNISIRSFMLEGFPEKSGYNTMILVDGKPSEDEDDPWTITRELQPGIHQIEVWYFDSFPNLKKLKPILLVNKEDSDEMMPCPDEMFNPKKFPPLIQKEVPIPSKITLADKSNFEIDFDSNLEARAIRLLILGHEGKVPVIKHLRMKDRTGEERLPTTSDYKELRTNNRLEVIPGDKVSVRYEDKRFIGMSKEKKVDIKGDVLSVAFNDGTIGASFLKYENTLDGRKLVLEDIRRFKMGADIAFIIRDVDMDISSERDKVKFNVKTSNGFTKELMALETAEHSGKFHGRFFPQLEKATRPAEIEITRGATITATYRDTENTSPGVPTDRSVTIEHARYIDPKFTVVNVTSMPIKVVPKEDKSNKGKSDSKNSRRKLPETFEPRRAIGASLVDGDDAKTKDNKTLVNSSIVLNVSAPHLALANSSKTTLYVQSESGRKIYAALLKKNGKKVEKNPQIPFDLNVPGTLKIDTGPSEGSGVIAPLGYTNDKSFGSSKKRRVRRKSMRGKRKGFSPALNKGSFSFKVPLQMAEQPEISFANRSAENLAGTQIPDYLAVKPNDTIYIAYPYFGKEDFYDDKKEGRAAKWFTAKYTMDSHIFMDMMDSSFNAPLTKAFVGEKVYLRVIAAGKNISAKRDEVQVRIKSLSGSEYDFTLRETEPHSGTFKGIFRLSYLVEGKQKVGPDGKKAKLPAIELHGFPVLYDDKVTVSYLGGGQDSPPDLKLSINNGSDGLIEPFSKRFTDDGIAIKTSFTLAECFFELARMHKKQNAESLARREMKHAEKLLLEALSSHRDEEQQAHAEYLLGNLAQEYASLSKNDDSRKSSYSDALARYKKVVTDFPNADFAAKSQYKIAFVYDKMDKIEGMQTMEIAIEEYVKLAYKYPEDELIPKVMARIGQYFQARGQNYKNMAKDKEAKEEGSGGAEMRQAFIEFLKAANVYNKLSKRFPDDPLADLSHLAAAINYMRCEYHNKAIAKFIEIYNNEDIESDHRAQAMYWSGICLERGARDPNPVYKITVGMRAVQHYNRVRYEYSSSKWAKYARGRLVDPNLAESVEMEEKRKEAMLEMFKKK